MTFAEAIAAEQDTIERGEAAITIATHARDRGDAELLLDALDLTHDITYKWNLTRAAYLIVSRCRHTRFSANTLRRWLPPRAHPLIPAVISALVRGELAAGCGERVKSESPGAHRRRVEVYALTRDGEELAARIEPMPGLGLLTSRLV